MELGRHLDGGWADGVAVPTKSCRARAETTSSVCNLSAVPVQS